jgi:thiamine-phosphate pyrophosphorylase
MLDRSQLLTNRDMAHDVGTSIETPQESHRESLSSVAQAGIQRTQQALRCLEEYGKLVSKDFARHIEQLRYQAYEFFAEVELAMLNERRWPSSARLYVLVDLGLPIQDFIERAMAISEAGVDVIQLRDKSAGTCQLIDYTLRLQEAIDSDRTRIVINDRVDVAASLGLDVHLGQTDLSYATARRLMPPASAIGISTHDLNQARVAESQGADYIGCGPTFPSRTKKFEDFAGLAFLRQVAKQLVVPAFAIGGVDLENLDEVLSTGVPRVAVSQAIWQAREPGSAARQFSERLGRAAEQQIVERERLSKSEVELDSNARSSSMTLRK